MFYTAAVHHQSPPGSRQQRLCGLRPPILRLRLWGRLRLLSRRLLCPCWIPSSLKGGSLPRYPLLLRLLPAGSSRSCQVRHLSRRSSGQCCRCTSCISTLQSLPPFTDAYKAAPVFAAASTVTGLNRYA
ncbi:unnamed protein product, partial [Ixodes hexagonus]